jgi:hypothetical protein
VLPDGDVVAGGYFTLQGTTPMSRIAHFDGTAWSEVDGGVGAAFSIRSVQTLSFSTRGTLFAAGDFATAGGVVSPNFARALSTCPAKATPFGTGCAGSAGPSTLQPLDLPWTGGTFHARADGMNQAVLAVRSLGTVPALAPLPLAAPGCSLFVQPLVLDLLVPVGDTVAVDLPIPPSTVFMAQSLLMKIVGVEIGPAGTLGLFGSNGLDLTTGSLGS